MIFFNMAITITSCHMVLQLRGKVWNEIHRTTNFWKLVQTRWTPNEMQTWSTSRLVMRKMCCRLLLLMSWVAPPPMSKRPIEFTIMTWVQRLGLHPRMWYLALTKVWWTSTLSQPATSSNSPWVPHSNNKASSTPLEESANSWGSVASTTLSQTCLSLHHRSQ